MTQKRHEQISKPPKKGKATERKNDWFFSDDVRDWYTTTKKTDRERVNEIKDWE